MRPMRSFLAAALVLLASPAIAADEPEAVYMKFHRAGLEADAKAMRAHSSEAQQGRMRTDADAKEQAQKLRSILPSSYAITGRAAGSARVVLNLHGTGGGLAGDSGAAAGKVTLIKEGEQWKVDRVEWLPGGPPPPQPAARQPVDAYGTPVPPRPPSGASSSAASAPAASAPAAAAPAAAAPRSPSTYSPPPPPPPSGRGFNPANQRPPGMGEPPR